MNYLLDLERSILTGETTYWKPNQFGYTNNIQEAGLYSDEVAKEIAEGDLDNRTVIVPLSIVERIVVPF